MSFYEPSGIQQEGRIFEIGEEAGSVPGQCSEGSGGEGEKRRKLLESKARYRAKKKLLATSIGPQTLQRSANWLPCAKCLAAIGCGSKVTARILGIVTHGGVGDALRAAGVKRFVPPSGSWKQATSPKITAAKPKKKKSPTFKMQYEAACLKDICGHRMFPDWSCLWKKELEKRRARERYNSLSAEERKDWNRLSSARNPGRRAESTKRWKRLKMQTDPVYRMLSGMRARLSQIIKRANVGGYENMVGCTIDQLRAHLRSTFKRGMTWDNYGTHWHVDHILPCASFDHSNPKQVKQCWHWTNLRALEAIKNLEKGSHITEPQMQLLLCITR